MNIWIKRIIKAIAIWLLINNDLFNFEFVV